MIEGGNGTTKKLLKHQKRFLKLLSKHSAGVAFDRGSGDSVKISGNDRQHAFPIELFDYCIERQLVNLDGNRVSINASGRACLLKLLYPDTDMRDQHLNRVETTIIEQGRPNRVLVDSNESPLSRLYLRKDKSGNSWINEYEFRAGERLRSDFEKAQLQPRVSANWISSVASGGRSANTSAELSDFALDARKRVEKALDRLGPELSGVVLDICCFLKGLETVERDRRWPPRSAKLMLRTGLRELVRHYGLKPVSRNTGSHHWGVDGFRPAELI